MTLLVWQSLHSLHRQGFVFGGGWWCLDCRVQWQEWEA